VSTHILGISAFYHDSAACLVTDGRIVAAAQEERFTRKKHDHRFPINAVNYCLKEAGITAADLTYVGFYDRPMTKFERLVETCCAFAPATLDNFMKSVPGWLRSKLHLKAEMDRALGAGAGGYRGRYLFCDHHESHAASAFFPSPFEDAAILTIDGVGEWSTTTLGHGRGNKVSLTHEIRFPHSVGLLYSAFTYYTGFKVNSGEYKVMGLAPYGEPRFAKLITDHLIRIKDDGSFWMDMSYFNYCRGMTMTNDKFHRLFGAPPRQRESLVTQREMDLAASVQVVCEEVMIKCARHAAKVTGSKNLVMAGGVALNCVGNGKILRDGCFENVWIQPASGDAGGALGVALLGWHHVLGSPRTPSRPDTQSASYLGPRVTTEDARKEFDRLGAVYHVAATEDELVATVAELMASEKVIGWFQGRMEFGPRALGARSIIGDARSDQMQTVMNVKIKFRESFRPFAPSVLKERASEFFDFAEKDESPYMLLVAPVRDDKRLIHDDALGGGNGAANGPANGAPKKFGIDLLKEKRSTIQAVTHVDFSARLQTIDQDRHGRYYKLIKAFEQRTGCPVIINTSFNIRGEPIVCTPEDAYRCLLGTNMDVLVVENCILYRHEQPNADSFDAEAYKKQFELD
jgi:carbamoyltransferase